MAKIFLRSLIILSRFRIINVNIQIVLHFHDHSKYVDHTRHINLKNYIDNHGDK